MPWMSRLMFPSLWPGGDIGRAMRRSVRHGPHNIRDVLATHFLKQTGSYEQASYAIQDTPEVVA